jgi:hypothetical protein
MPRINEEGAALVKITDAIWKPCKGGLQAHITGVTAAGNYATGRITANETIIQSGPHKGKKMVDKALEDLVQLGLPKDAAGKAQPHRLSELEGKQVEFVMEERTWENDEGEERTVMDVKYINSVGGGKAAATKDEVSGFFGKLGFSGGGDPTGDDFDTDAEIPF